MDNSERFGGRGAIVTGGANGLGLACAHRLAAEGAHVAVFDVDGRAVESAVARLRDEGHDVAGHVVDVTDQEQLRSAVAAHYELAGSVDVLVTMAGIYPRSPLAHLDLDTFRRVVDVNLTGTFAAIQEVLPHMKRAAYGRIVTTASSTVLLAPADLAAYVASKSGVIGLTRAVARDAGPHGITANVVLPGLIASEQVLARDNDDDLVARTVAQQAVPRRGEPEDIAEAVAYLASPRAGFVTGQSLAVSGGDRFL